MTAPTHTLPRLPATPEVEIGEITFIAGTNADRQPHTHGRVEIFNILSGRLDRIGGGESHLLEQWRTIRCKSQLDLAIEAKTSPGRSASSRRADPGRQSGWMTPRGRDARRVARVKGKLRASGSLGSGPE